MNETTKNILIEEIEHLLSKILLPENGPVIQEVSLVTDSGNLPAIFANMKFFLEKGVLPKSGEGYSNLPAIVFGLPTFQDFLMKELEDKIPLEEIRGLGRSYLDAYKKEM